MHSCLLSSSCRVGGHSAICQIVSTQLRPNFLVLLSSCGDENESYIYTICLVLDFFFFFRFMLKNEWLHFHDYVYRIYR